MIRNSDTTSYFNYRREEGQNPYIGFMSFQHYRGEKLYSDLVVRPENKMTETEHVECYPISPEMEEKGREQGFYPDTTVAYFRFLWKEFEPEQGKFNYKFVKDLIEGAKAHNQSLIIRIMPHSTRAVDDVPHWLKKLIPCPERPDFERVKDSPADPLFVKLFCRAIKELADAFDKEEYLEAVDISLPGAWGEGHKLELYSKEDFDMIIKTYTEGFKHTRLIGQVSRGDLINKASLVTSLPVGWRGDGLGSPAHIYKLYPQRIEAVKENWKKAPVSFESYWWLCEWERQNWDIDEIINYTLVWHVSSINAKSMPIPHKWKDKIDKWISKMGYHFAIDYFKYPTKAKKGDEIEIKLAVDNVGVAPIYRKMPLTLRLENKENKYDFVTDADITGWLPGKNGEKFTVQLPNDIESGEYSVQIGIFDEINPVVYFCTDACRKGSFYKMGEISVE